MILTELTDYIVDTLGSFIADDDMTVIGKGLAFQQADGRVVSFDVVGGERTFVGVDDTGSDFFYVRMLQDEIASQQTLDGQGGCRYNTYTESANLRAVAVVETANANALVWRMKHGLAAMQATLRNSVTTVKLQDLQLNITSSNAVIDSIFEQETLQQKGNWNNNINLAAVDFTLQWTYKIKADNTSLINLS